MVERCGGCHDGIKTLADLTNIRMTTRGDFDGNGKEEGLAKEVGGLQNQLYAAIQTYARNVGGVGIGFSQHAGMAIVCDGTLAAAQRIERVLWNDQASGVMRHADAGYEEAIACAKEHELTLPSLTG